MTYSFIIPVHNEEDNLRPLMAEIEAVRKCLDAPAEVIFVNDGSTDGSGGVLDWIRSNHAAVVVVDFDRNAGQSAALAAGIEHAAGSVIITLDADLQNDPADLPALLAHYPQHDVVIGRRAERRDGFVKRATSRIANGIRNRITGDRVSDTGCSLRVLNAAVVKKIPAFNGMHRFIPTLCRMQGASVKEIDVHHRHRVHGSSHYGTWNRALRALVDAVAVRWLIERKLRYAIVRVKR
jgi:glycosyltransferase involved in cell wall biosynthesis